MFKYFEPNRIFSITSRAPKYVLSLFIIVLSVGLAEALILSPEDYKQSHSVRIMYVHVPAAWITLGIFSAITLFSIVGYIFKIKNFFLISKSLAPSGFVFNIIALVTGSIWGKPTWGTWWAWDARITSMLILVLFYIMYLMAWRIYENNDKAFKIITNDIKNVTHLKSIKVEPILNVDTNTVDSYYVVCSFTANDMIDYVSTYTRKAIINNETIITKL